MNESRLKRELKELVLLVKSIIDEKLKKNEVTPDKEEYFHWKVDRLEYTSQRTIDTRAHGESFFKEEWYSAILIILNLIKDSQEYKASLKELIFGLGDEQSKENNSLVSLIKVIADHYLKQRVLDEKTINKFIEIFVKDLRDEPVKCWANIEITGIILQPEKVELDPNISIRRVKKEDLEKEELPLLADPTYWYLAKPSSIVRIQSMQQDIQDLQETIRKVISIFKLFKVGSVKFLRYDIDTDSIIKCFKCKVTANETRTSTEQYRVNSNEIKKFIGFFKIMKEYLPENFYKFEQKNIDYITIAYNRYNDAILDGGITEKRIAYAIMGLEALFLKENQELVYRLKMRVSKLFAVLGFNPYNVKEKINDAYKVRSDFVHGDVLDEKDKKKIECKYGSIKDFLHDILNYLRASLILNILVDMNKNEIIKLIDDSFIDNKRIDILKEEIERWKEYLIFD